MEAMTHVEIIDDIYDALLICKCDVHCEGITIADAGIWEAAITVGYRMKPKVFGHFRSMYHWFGLQHVLFLHLVGKCIIPVDALIFFRG